MKFTLFYADCLEIPGNCTYSHKVEITGKDALLQAVTHDYVCAEYQGNYRSNENFIGSENRAVLHEEIRDTQWACPCRRFILHTCPTREHSSLNGHFTKENHV